jgi:MoxR-like ATPase
MPPTAVQQSPEARATTFAEQFDRLAANIDSFIRGKPDAVRRALVCMLAEGHLMIDDVPGVGKTSLAKALAQSLNGEMRRIQFTPDLLPSDVTGVMVYDSGDREFVFHPGAVFANIVLADEINRASPKTQSALLEVMAERQVTVDAVQYVVPQPFIVIATQNPIEHGGTYLLPEAQLDRFMMRIELGYPDHDSEMEVVQNGAQGARPEQLRAVLDTTDMLDMIDVARRTHLAPAVVSYLVTITAATRHSDKVRLGVSPRGSLALAQACQANAASQGRTFVTADDVKALAPHVLGHRMILRPEAELSGETAVTLLHTILASVPTPHDRVPG